METEKSDSGCVSGIRSENSETQDKHIYKDIMFHVVHIHAFSCCSQSVREEFVQIMQELGSCAETCKCNTFYLF